jgi:hypothetical protein
MTEVPKREVPTMIVIGSATSVAKRRRQADGTSSHHDPRNTCEDFF